MINWLEKLDREDIVEPPLQTSNLLYGVAITLTLSDLWALASISNLSLSPIPSNMVLPPERIMLL